MFSLEVIWRAGSAYVFTRGEGDVFTDGGLTAGEPDYKISYDITPIANVVDTNYTVVAKLPKSILRGTAIFDGLHERLRGGAAAL